MIQRIALIGAGGMGRIHADCFSKIAGSELVAVCDANLQAAQSLADLYGVPAFSDARDMLESVDCDAIDICLPTHMHFDHIMLGAQAGKHICCEKPFCRTLDQCREAISACDAAGSKLFVAHVLRWFPEYRRARELVTSGGVGAPAVVRTWRGGGSRVSPDSWFADGAKSGGVLLDLMIHDFDWLIWTFGEVERVFTRGSAGDNASTDHTLAIVKFKSGLIGHVEGTWATPGEFRYGYEIAGDNGLISFSNLDCNPMSFRAWDDAPGNNGVVIPVGEDEESPYSCELRSFIDYLNTGSEPGVTPHEAMAAVELALAALDSAKSGRPVIMGGAK